MASKLILTRKGEFINRRQRFKVFINDKEVGFIRNDDTAEYELEPGSYTLQCKLNWTGSRVPNFEIEADGNTYLRVRNGMKYYYPLYFMLLAGLFLPFFFKIANHPAPDWINSLKIILIVPALIYIILYMSVLRSKYLDIVEDKTNPFVFEE